MSNPHKHDLSISGRDANNLAAIIMAGGAGTRFWPVSTQNRPKQFLRLLGERTLLQESFDRIRGLVDPSRILVLTNWQYVDTVLEQLPEIPPSQVIGEPCRRDTAAAVALAALLAQHLFGECTTMLVTADHRITPTEQFQECLVSAAQAASQSNSLYTIGIKPNFPATGYGYLHCGECLSVGDGPSHYRVQAFKEKPSLEKAREFLADGEHYWNSGMFVWHTQAILSEFAKQLPGHIQSIKPALEHFATPMWSEALTNAFEPLPKVSVDYGIMEKALDVRMTMGNFDWFDVGGWLAVAPFLQLDASENRYRGQLVSYDSHHNIVFSDNPQSTIALVGVENMVVVQAGERTLVVPQSKLEQVKKLVDQLDLSSR